MGANSGAVHHNAASLLEQVCGPPLERAALLPCFRAPGSRVVAVCDVSSKRLAEVRELAGGERVRAYHDYRQLLADKDVDAVLITTNVHWHVPCTIGACQAGKDVYVEKPLCHFSGEGRFAVAAALRRATAHASRWAVRHGRRSLTGA